MPELEDPNERGTVGTVEESAFKEAFDQAEKAEAPPAISAVDDPAGQADTLPAKEVDAGKDDGKADDGNANAQTAAADANANATQQAVTQSDDDGTFEQRFKTLKGIHKHDKEEWEKEREKLLKDLEEAKKPPPEPEKPAPEKDTKVDLAKIDLTEDLTDEEKEALKEYEDEFDLVSKMEGKKRDVAFKQLMRMVKEDMAALRAEVQNHLTPVNALVEKDKKAEEEAINAAHFAAIKGKHHDFEKYRDDGSIKKWIETKPKYLQQGLFQIYHKGTADDIVDLITDFKAENNIEIISSNVVDLNEKKEQRRLANAAVVTRRGAVNAQRGVATTFVDAFDEAVNKGG